MNPLLSDRVSVIVPVYNTEKFLEQAIQSILSQTYKNWELLLVDDGSTDSSGEICDCYASRDNRIQAFHTENRGYGSARNAGLHHASGQWIIFLDSDDYLVPLALEHMLEQGNHADLVMALFQTTPKRTMHKIGITGGRFKSLDELDEVFTELYNPYFFLSVCAKMYRRKIIENGFPVQNGSLMSDWLFNFQVLPACRGICFIPEIIYYYRRTEQISVCNHFHSEWLFVSKRVYETVIDMFPNHPQIQNFMAQRYAFRVGQHMTAIASLHVLRIQKLAMITAEQNDPFYQKDEICRVISGKRYAAIWKAFLTGNAEATLTAAEQFLTEFKHT